MTLFQPFSSKTYRQSARRRGQALLLAVLVLLFAALLGTAFIAVVAINIGQTARQEERDKAKVAAQAGLDYANRQLTYSENATNWRPTATTTPPLATDPAYNFYWTTFDIAQGWDQAGYAKFPDPRSQNQNLSAPNYMLKVEKVLDADSDNANKDKTGALRVSVIGLSSDDPNSFQKIIAYKGGAAQQPFMGGMRTVSNYDYSGSTVPVAELASSGSPTSITVQNQKGSWPDVPFYIMRGDPLHGGNVQGHIVTAVSGTTLTLSALTPIAGSVVTQERVELAAALGAPTAVDYNVDGTKDTTNERVDFKVSQATTPGSTLVNGGLIWYGNAYTQNLRASSLATTAVAPGAVKSSGLIQTLGTVSVAGTYDNSGTGVATSGTLQSSNGAGFPFSGTGTFSQKIQLVDDGLNRLAGATDTERQVKPFTPPDLTGGGDGLGRYRQLTKYSTSTDSSNPQGSAYGYGEGIYLNNFQDKERIGTGSGVQRDMTQSEMNDMWFSTANTSSYMRLGTPDASNLDTKSLEEMHLRGWIGPDEFCARGALVELLDDNPNTGTANDPALKITLDARADNTAGDLTRSKGSVAAKGWRDAAGNLMGDGTLGGVYTQIAPWPTKGVLFAEGNIRIRGSLTNTPPRSLTVVSMNNIYIEGSLTAGTTYKVLLLARKNVVVNPTRVLGRPDAQSRLSSNVAATAAGNTISLPVYDGFSFNQGDSISIGAGTATDPGGVVVSPPAAGSISVTLLQNLPAQSANVVVRTAGDPVDTAGLPYTTYANRLAQFNQALQRRVNLPTGTTAIRLAMRHSAEYRKALTVTTVQGTPPAGVNPGGRILSEANLTSKLVAAADPTTGLIQSTNKLLKVDYTDTGGTPPDWFPNKPPPTLSFTDENAARAYQVGQPTAQSGSPDLADDMKNRNSANPLDWQYATTVLNSYNTLASPLVNPPAYFLAAVGNRADFYYTGTSGTYPWRQPIFKNDAPIPYDIPMATSVYAFMNGGRALITSDRYNPTLNAFETVKQFGFNFLHGLGDPAANAVDTAEDALTTDQTFYRNNFGAVPGTGTTPDNTYYTLDSRILSNAQAGNNTLAFRLSPDAQNYFATGSDPSIPYYRLARLKLENTAQANGNRDFEVLEPGYEFDINAYVYAQEGSWLVIPGAYFDDKVKTDATGAYEEMSDGTGNKLRDLDRNNVTSRGEKAAAYRFARYNYQVNFTGAIMENHTAVVEDPDAAGPQYGMVSDWTDKWATVSLEGTNWTGNATTDNLRVAPDGSAPSYGNGNFATINYSFDPDAALSAVNTASVLNTDTGFRPPISSEWLYQSG
jgi:hypothetical protein